MLGWFYVGEVMCWDCVLLGFSCVEVFLFWGFPVLGFSCVGVFLCCCYLVLGIITSEIECILSHIGKVCRWEDAQDKNKFEQQCPL